MTLISFFLFKHAQCVPRIEKFKTIWLGWGKKYTETFNLNKTNIKHISNTNYQILVSVGQSMLNKKQCDASDMVESAALQPLVSCCF